MKSINCCAIPQQADTANLSYIVEGLKHDIDEYFTRAPLKLVMELPESRTALLTAAGAFYGTCEQFLQDAAVENASPADLADSFHNVAEAWHAFEHTFRPMNSEPARRVLNRVEEGINSIADSLQINDQQFDRRRISEYAYALLAAADNINRDTQIWVDRDQNAPDAAADETAKFLTHCQRFSDAVTANTTVDQLRQGIARTLRALQTRLRVHLAVPGPRTSQLGRECQSRQERLGRPEDDPRNLSRHSHEALPIKPTDANRWAFSLLSLRRRRSAAVARAIPRTFGNFLGAAVSSRRQQIGRHDPAGVRHPGDRRRQHRHRPSSTAPSRWDGELIGSSTVRCGPVRRTKWVLQRVFELGAFRLRSAQHAALDPPEACPARALIRFWPRIARHPTRRVWPVEVSVIVERAHVETRQDRIRRFGNLIGLAPDHAIEIVGSHGPQHVELADWSLARPSPPRASAAASRRMGSMACIVSFIEVGRSMTGIRMSSTVTSPE